MGVGPAAGECGAAADGGSAAIEKPPGCCGIQKIMREASGLLGPLRLPFLLLPLACVAAGAGAAFWRMGRLDWGTALLVLVGAVCAHASVNALNEYSDFRTGVDARTRRTPFSGGSGTLQRRPALAGYALGVGLVLAAITAVIGGYLALQVGPILFPLGVGGLAVVLLYTPWLNRNPALCLVAPGLGFGTCMVMGTDVVLGDGYSWTGFFASLVPFFLVSNLLLLNQFPDVEADRAGGRRHLVIAYGLRVGAVVYTLFHAGAFLSVGMIFISPTVWGDVLGHKGPDGKPICLIALKNPAIVSMTAAFVVGWLVSLMTKEQTAEDAFEDEKLRTYLGIGAE